MNKIKLVQETRVCRLCYSRNTETDTVDIYSDKGKERDLLGKINRYLYLRVAENDAHPKTICWMCSNQLNTFQKFYEKVRKPLVESFYFFFIRNMSRRHCSIFSIRSIKFKNRFSKMITKKIFWCRTLSLFSRMYHRPKWISFKKIAETTTSKLSF